jgi:hypothetical protein
MTTMTISGTTVRLRFRAWEKVAGLIRDHEVPVSAITSVEVVGNGLAAARGLRAPGLGLPGLRKIGTWRGRGHKSLVSVRRHQPAVRLRLAGQRFDEVLVGADDAEGLADRLRAHVG